MKYATSSAIQILQTTRSASWLAMLTCALANIRRAFGFVITVTAIMALASCSAPQGNRVERLETGRGYVDTSVGQVHYYVVVPKTVDTAKPPIVLFHPSPRSGLIYQHLLTELGKDRVAIAIDTPGFGGSDPIAGEPTMANFANVMAETLEGLGIGSEGRGKADIFGYHTGSLMAAELAISRPDLVRKVVLGGIPLRSPEERAGLLARIDKDAKLSREKVDYAWNSTIESREEGVPFDEAAVSFAENVRALAGEYWKAYYAVWTYPIEDRLPKIQQPVLVLNNNFDTEFEPTSEAHRRLLPGADYVELRGIKELFYPFSVHPEVWARAMRTWLDSPTGS